MNQNQIDEFMRSIICFFSSVYAYSSEILSYSKLISQSRRVISHVEKNGGTIEPGKQSGKWATKFITAYRFNFHILATQCETLSHSLCTLHESLSHNFGLFPCTGGHFSFIRERVRERESRVKKRY